MPKLLVIRFSALGDVAMTIPVIDSLARQYPDLEIMVLTRKNFNALFERLPENVHFKGIELQDYQGITGLNRLYRELRSQSFDYVADLHDVLRTQFLRFRFKLHGSRVARIEKGRSEKKKLVRKRHKILKQLATSFARYQKVFGKLGFGFSLVFKSIYDGQKADIADIEYLTGEKKTTDKWIGIAPFAKHKGKIYPLELQEKIVAHFVKEKNVKLFLFGGGKREKDLIEEWRETHPSIISVIGKLDMSQELRLLNNIDLTISMDSANMHLASLVGTPVFSIWGATHPYAGFMGWNQPIDNAIQTDLYCRPCSVFGQKPCYRGDYACMYNITPESVITKITRFLEL